MAEVKPEIKVEGDTKMEDVDEFEEDTDLQFPPPQSQAWLIKGSEDLWKAWNAQFGKVPQGEHMQIGKLRVFHQKPGDDPNKQKIQIRLTDDNEHHRMLPKTYNLEVKSNGYNNTVVFSEKDLAGHKSQSYNRNVNKPQGINKYDRYSQQQQTRKPGTYRTAIPKQTALAPQIANEAVANPVDDASTLNYFVQSYKSALTAGNKTNFVGATRMKHPGQDNDGFAFGSLTSKPGKGKKKVVKEKAVRMDKDKLLDALQNCFKEYQYWSLRALRKRLNQPEAYIRESLEDMAVLMRSGDFVQNYKLKDDYARMLAQEDIPVKAEVAPEAKIEDDSDDGTGDEMTGDDEGDFEDVKIE